MGTEDWVLRGTKLVRNTSKEKLKIQSRVWNFKNTMLKKRRRKRKREKTNKVKPSRKNYKENIGAKLIINTKKQKLKIQSRVWNFKNTMLKKRRRKRKREKTNKNKPSCKNYKENIGTKLITNTKKHKLKIQSTVWNFRYTMLYKRRRERNRGKKKKSQKL